MIVKTYIFVNICKGFASLQTVSAGCASRKHQDVLIALIKLERVGEVLPPQVQFTAHRFGVRLVSKAAD
jgi:hypothetical protein